MALPSSVWAVSNVQHKLAKLLCVIIIPVLQDVKEILHFDCRLVYT